MNPIAEHETAARGGEKKRKAPYYLDDLMSFVDYKTPDFIVCAGRKSRSRGENGSRLRNSQFQLADVI